MSDFLKNIERIRQQRAGAENNPGESNENLNPDASPEENIDSLYRKKIKEYNEKNNQPSDPNKKQFNLEGMGDTRTPDEYGTDKLIEQYNVEGGLRNDSFADPNSFSPDQVYNTFLEQSQKSILYGTGKLLGQFGDLFQYLGSVVGTDLREGNVLSRSLQDAGQSIMEEYKRYIPEDMQDPEFSLSTFMNPDFWSTHVAEAIPQLVEILALRGTTTVARKTIEKGARSLLKEAIGEGAEAAAKAQAIGLRATTRGVYGGARRINEVNKGRGLIGKMLTDKGVFTNKAAALFEGGLGGALMNWRVSASNAAELYNTYKNIPNADGTGNMFTEEELNQMAAGAFSNNTNYMLIDMLSFGFTFGKGWDKIGSLATKASSSLSPAMQSKVIGGMFAKTIAPAMKKITQGNTGAFLRKGIAEGMEETFQESFEEWSKFQSYKDVTGSWKGYEGVTQDYDNYFDYYLSKDSEALRAISFGAGFGMGSLANIKQLVNKVADDHYKTLERSESIKKSIKYGNEGQAWRDYQIRSQMAELVFDGKEVYFDDYIQNWYEQGVITDEEFDRYNIVFNEMLAAKNDIANLNIPGKKAYMNNLVKIYDIEDKIGQEMEKSENIKKTLIEQFQDSEEELTEALFQEEERVKTQIGYFSQILNDLNQNKKNLLIKKQAKDINWTITRDKDGNEFIVPDNKSEEDTSKTTEEEVNDKPKPKKNIINNLVDGAKEIYNSFFGDNKKDEDKPKDVVDKNDIDSTEIDNEITKKKEEFNNDPDIAQAKKDFSEGNIDFEQLNDIVKKWNDDNGLTELYNQKSKLKNTSTETKTDDDKSTDNTKEFLNAIDTDKKDAVVSNPNIIDDDKTTSINSSTYNSFQQNGEIPSGVINYIADKVYKRKKLTPKQKEVYNKFKTDVDSIVEQKQKNEKENLSNLDVNNNPEDAFVADVINGKKSDKKSIEDSDKDEEFLKALKAKKGKNEGRARVLNLNPTKAFNEVVKNLKSKFKNIVQDYKSFKKEISNESDTDFENYPINRFDDADLDSLAIGQQVALNEKMKTMFPNDLVTITRVANLSKIIGYPVTGYTISGAIFIDENSWHQPVHLKHELSHVYYQILINEPETKAFLNLAMKNQSLLEQVMKDYNGSLLYEFTDPQTGLKQSFTKDQILNYLYVSNSVFAEDLTKENILQIFNELTERGTFKLLPLNEQEIIKEEVFAYTLEGVLSEKYNSYFDENNDIPRQYLAKKFWGKVKQKANIFESDTPNMVEFLKTLDPEQEVEFSDLKTFIFDKLREGVSGKSLTGPGRARIEEEQINEQENNFRNIAAKLQEERALYGASKLIVAIQDQLELEQDLNQEELENSPSDWYDTNRLKYGEKASVLIRDFSKAYQRALNYKFMKENPNGDWSKAEIFDKDKLQNKLFSIAKKAESNLDFINKIENSEIQEIDDFNNFLNKTRKDKNTALSAMYFIYKNQSLKNSVTAFLDSNGNYVIQNNLNSREFSITENILDKQYKAYYMFERQQNNDALFENEYLNEYLELFDSVVNIHSNDYSGQDIYNVLKAFSNENIDVVNIFKDNILNINGENFSLDKAVRGLVKKAFPFINGKPHINPKWTYGENAGKVKNEVRTFIQSVVATNRKFTAEYTVFDANNNQVPVRTIDNFISREIQNMNSDALKMKRSEFINKYGNKSSKLKVGTWSNNLLNFIWNESRAGNPIELNLNHGIINQKNNNSNVIKESNSTEQSINELLAFVSSDNRNTFMYEVGRFSDSPTSYIIKVTKVNLKDFGSFNEQNKFQFYTKAKAAMEGALSVYNQMGGDLDMKSFIEMFQNEISNYTDFVEKNINSLNRLKAFEKFITNNKLNEDGKKKIAEYTINQIMTGLNFSEIFMPNFNSNEYIKRAKLNMSPGFSVGKNVKVETIPFYDPENDSGIYILPEQAKRIKNMGGHFMPLGNSYKMLNAGIEHNNKNFKGKNIYDKGYFTVLTDEFVKNNPKLKNLQTLLKKRFDKYIELNGESSEDFLDGSDNYFVYAYPTSSDKANSTKVKITDENNNLTQDGQNFTLENIDSDFVQNYLDDLFYEKDLNEEMFFNGLSGENLVVQQVMDQVKYTSNNPVQFLRFITTNASINNNLALAEEIQTLIVGKQNEILKEYTDALKTENPSDLTEFLLKHMLQEDVDPSQLYLMKNNKLPVSTPALRELAKNTIANIIKRKGNKLETPGTVAQAKAPTYEKKHGITNGKKGLSFYTKNSDGTHNPGEAVLPMYMSGKVRQRQYLIFGNNINTTEYSDEKIDIYEKRAKELAAQYQTNYGVVTNENGIMIGYYIEGDKVLATRIPAHGPQSTGVFEVIDFDGEASNIMLPNEFSMNITGGDFDGDQFFIQHKTKSSSDKWNQAFDKITKLWLSKEMANEVVLPIEFVEETEQAIKDLKSFYNKSDFQQPMLFSPMGKIASFDNTIITKNSVGITANLHSVISLMSNYGTKLSRPIIINGKKAEMFQDWKGEQSRTISSAKLFNIILDNSKHHYASILGINEHTDSDAMILTNLGFSLYEVGVILNHPIVQKLNDLKKENQNIFTENLNAMEIMEKVKKDKSLNIGNVKDKDITIDFKNFNTPENNASIFNLMEYLGKINADISIFSNIIQGHNKLETNSFIIDKNIDKFLELKNSKNIEIPLSLFKNPVVENYLNVYKTNKSIQNKIDPVNKDGIKESFEKTINSFGKNLNDKNIKKLHKNYESFFDARLLGLNNISINDYENLINNQNKENIFNQMANTIAALKNIKKEKTNAFNQSILFKKALRYSLHGKNKFISVNHNFFANHASDEEIMRAIVEFNNLPQKIKNDLMLYDLMKTGWKGSSSLYNLFNTELKEQIAYMADYAIKTNNKINKKVLDTLEDRVIQQNPELLLDVKKYPFEKNSLGQWSLTKEFLTNPEHIGMVRNILKGNKSYFIVTEGNKKQIIKFKGWDRTIDFQNVNDAEYKMHAPTVFMNYISKLPVKPYNENIGVISIPDDSTYSPQVYSGESITMEDLNNFFDKKKTDKGMARKIMASDYYNYTNQLSLDKFAEVTQGDINLPSTQIKYQEYLKEFKKAQNFSSKINEETVKNMSDEELYKYFCTREKLEDGEIGFGHRNKLAYAIILRPIITELTNRLAKEQSNLSKGKAKYSGEDLGYFQSWLMSNNIPSNQPEIQGLVRRMEVEFKKFQQEKKKYVEKINSATNNLYKEKLGYMLDGSFIGTIKHVMNSFFGNQEQTFKKLYQELIEYQEVIDDKTGKVVTNMKYKSAEQIESDFKKGIVSPAQYEFYKATTEVTNALRPYALANNQNGRTDYIPHTAPGWLEIKAKRGLLGLAVNSKNIDERVLDVKLYFTDPIDNKKKLVDFKTITDIYNNLSKTNQKGFDEALSYVKLKKKALDLLSRGVNEDGSKIQISIIETNSAIGDVFLDRFSQSRSIKSTDLPSMDLNKAFNDYVHSALFNHGNENFSGMNKMIPLVDGILALTESRNDKNAHEYVNKVWKEYFLKGSKQSIKYNSNLLGAVGITTDDTIDFLTKASLFYWLGWKGLALGYGIYSVGNVLIGKYQNIKNAGAGSWAKGEKRFWKGNKFDITDPFKGVKESIQILKNNGFMDINIYDNVGLENKNSIEKFFSNIALFPMIWSEKWIQGVDFLGRLTDKEYEDLAAGKQIDYNRLVKLENDVKISHGKGYQPTDQRMIQMYSMGRNFLQFSRYIPTLFYDQFGKEDVNIYGEDYIGSYTMFGKTIQKVMTGEVKPAEFMKWYNNLDSYKKHRLNQGLVGFGLLAFLTVSENRGNGFFSDANPIMDPDKMAYKISTTPTIAMIN